MAAASCLSVIFVAQENRDAEWNNSCDFFAIYKKFFDVIKLPLVCNYRFFD